MADNKYSASDSTRNEAAEELFNQEATARINPNRKMSDDLLGHDELSSEELFMQNLQGRIDHDTADNLLPTIQSEGFSFEPGLELLDSLTESGVIPAGTVLATMSVPVEGGDFSFTLNDDRFVVTGERLVLKQDLTPQVGEEFSFAVQVFSNASSFEIDVPVRIDFNDLAEFTEEYISQAPQTIELSGSGLDENSEAGTFVANLIAVDMDNDAEAAFELTGVGADLFEVVGTRLVVKEGAVLDFETQSQLSVEITATDTSGNSFTQTVIIDLNDINEAPLLDSATFELNEGEGLYSAALQAEDRDINDQLTFVVEEGFALPAGLELSTNGDYSFDPANASYDHLAQGDSQIMTVPVKVVDSGGLESTAQIKITISGTNDAPVAGADVIISRGEGDSAISGSLGGSDVDAGTDLSYNASVDLPAGFTLDTDTGEYSFDPTDAAYNSMAVGDSQTLSIPVTVSDGDGGEAQQMITITIDGTNDAPVAGANVNASVEEGDSAISGSLGGSDVDAGTDLSYSANVALPAGFTLDSDTGEYSFDPTDAAYDSLSSTDSIQLQIPVTVSDGDEGTAQQLITIDVQGTNDAPVAGTAVNREVSEGDAVISGSLGGSDVDAGTDLNYNANVALPAGFTLDSDTGEYSFDPTDAAYDTLSSTDSIQLQIPVTVSDGDEGAAQQLITIDLQGTNDAPVAITSVGNVVDENAGSGIVVATLSATDVDAGEVFTYTLTDASGNFEIVGNQIRVKAGANIDFESAELHNVSVEVTDSAGNTYSENFALSVNNLNEGPTDITLTGGSVDENSAGGTVVATLAAADQDAGEVFTYTLTDASGNFEIVGNQIQVKAGANIDFESAELHNVSVEVTDSAGNTYSENFALSVNNLNEGPTNIILSGGSVDENSVGGTVVATLATADQDAGESFTYNLTDSSGHFEIVGNQIQMKAGASIDFESAELHNVSVEVTDSAGNTYSENFALSVNNLNEGPATPGSTGIDYSQYATETTDTAGLNQIQGSTGNDNKLKGTESADHITDPAGNDKIDAKGGDDVVDGGDGNDHINGGDGNDTLYGGAGNDKLQGGEGRDYLSGGEGNDKLDGGAGNDQLVGGEGNDDLRGGTGDDLISGGLGNDKVQGGDGSDTYIFNPFEGNDHFSGGTGGGWTDIIELSADGSSDPDNPWTITVDGQELEYDSAAKALELNPDTSGVVTMADGSELTFEGIEKIEW